MDTEVPQIEKETVGRVTFIQRIFAVKHFLFVASVAFLVLAVLARNTPYFEFDLGITRAIQRVHAPAFNTVMVDLTMLGNPPVAVAIVAGVSLVLLLINRKVAAMMTVFSSSGATLVGFMFKTLVARPRPDSLLIKQLGKFVRPDSFPSGHVILFMGLYGFLFMFVFTKFRQSVARNLILLLLLFLIVGIGFSRIYIGAHWFSDVLGSYLLGFVWLYFVIYLYNRYERKSPNK